MKMLNFLFRSARKQTTRPSLRSGGRRFLPRIETLEDRTALSTLTVTNLNDTGVAGDGSLRGQIAAAAPGDTVNFAAGLSGTIGLSGDLAIDRNLAILGNLDAAGNPLVTLNHGEAQGGTDLVVNGGVTASVFGLAFTGGSEHAILNHGSLTLDHAVVSNNQIGYHVGFMTYYFNGTINNDGTLVVQNSRITDNTVDLLADLGPSDASGGGAGIWNTGTLTVANSTIANNASPSAGSSSNISYGGGISNYGGTATITGCTIIGNSASEGGGIFISGGSTGGNSLTISNSTISGNSTPGSGGGIYVVGRPMSITDCVISGNTAGNDGGGISFFNGAAIPSTLTRCTVANNTSTGYGGGISLPRKGLVTVSDSTIAGNQASRGAGIYVVAGNLLGGATLALQSSTVAGNQAAGAGSGLYVSGPLSAVTHVTLTDTLVAGNTGGADVSGPVLSTSAFNLIGNGDGSSGLVNGATGNQVGTTAAPIDPLLGPLQDNGGLTPTMALLSGSPAIDAGSNTNIPAQDQRGPGFARATGAGIDIGAFEAPAATFQPGVMTHFGVTTVAGPAAGTPFNIMVQALDDADNPVPSYVGPIHFTITDGPAVLSQDYTVTAADAGAHAFAVTLTTAGTQVLTLTTDTPAGPLTERGAVTVGPAAATSLRLIAPSATTAGQSMHVTVTLLDAYGNVATGYTGTVHFTSSDAQAALPANYRFNSSDAGTHTFSVTLKTAGSQSITVTDTVTGSLTASAAGITVTPGALLLAFGGVPGSTTAGSAWSVTLTAGDAYGNTITGYTGTVHFTSSDAKAALPANYTFTSADAGTHAFSVTLKTAASQSITATDTLTSSLTATSAGIVVTPAAAAKFVLTAPASVTHGVRFSLTLTVQDAYGNIVTGYTGTVHFTSSDGLATLPVNYTFTAADAGVHTFASSVILRKKGKQTLTVTDLANSALTATDSISVI
jgi:hypothetical protein